MDIIEDRRRDSALVYRYAKQDHDMGRLRMHRRSKTIWIAALAACTAGDPGNGTDVPDIVAVPEMRVDGMANDLVPISWLSVSPSGVLAVLQPQDHAVRLFSQEGQSIAAIGRNGAGPGEFRRLVRGGWIGDTLWVSDTQLNRVTLIGPDGRVLTTVSVPMRVTAPPAAAEVYDAGPPWAMYGRDTILAWSLDYRGSSENGPPLIRVTTDGYFVGEVFHTPESEYGFSIPVPGGVAYGRAPFLARPHWVVSSDGRLVASVTTDVTNPSIPTYTVQLVSFRGDTLLQRTYPFVPTQISGGTLDSAINAETMRRDPSIRAQMMAGMREEAPPIYPAIRGLLIGDDGRIWLNEWSATAERPWIVLGKDGTVVGRLRLEANQVLKAANATAAWVVERDSLDVESVVRYRLDWH